MACAVDLDAGDGPDRGRAHGVPRRAAPLPPLAMGRRGHARRRRRRGARRPPHPAGAGTGHARRTLPPRRCPGEPSWDRSAIPRHPSSPSGSSPSLSGSARPGRRAAADEVVRVRRRPGRAGHARPRVDPGGRPDQHPSGGHQHPGGDDGDPRLVRDRHHALPPVRDRPHRQPDPGLRGPDRRARCRLPRRCGPPAGPAPAVLRRLRPGRGGFDRGRGGAVQPRPPARPANCRPAVLPPEVRRRAHAGGIRPPPAGRGRPGDAGGRA